MEGGMEISQVRRGRGSYMITEGGKIQKREWEGGKEENTEILVNKISRI